MKTPRASSSKAANSITIVNIENGEYKIVWDGNMVSIPLNDNKDVTFEVDGEGNFSDVNTGWATVFDKSAIVRRNTIGQDRLENYTGSISGSYLTLVDKTTKEKAQ